MSLADQDFDRTKSLGIFNVSTRLTERLAAHKAVESMVVLTNLSIERRLSLPPEVDRIRYDEAVEGRWSRMLWDQFGVYRATREAGLPWLFMPKGYASFLRRPPCQLAAFVHDAAHDFYQREHPGAFSRLEGWYFRSALRASLRDSRVIFTQSEFSKQEVLRLARKYNIAEPKTVVAGVGFSQEVAPRGPAPRDVMIMVSRLPHKRSAMAMEYLARWQVEEKFSGGIHLVGALPRETGVPSRERWRHDSRLADDEYQRAVANAAVVVYSSEYEGFGMPPVEAAIAGACPVYSDLPVTREVMRDAGFRFTNGDYASFAHAMNSAVSTSRDTIASWAAELSARHNWDAVTDRIVSGLIAAGE